MATAAADAAGLVPAGPGDLERRVMAAVKASEARGDPPLLRAVELARVAAGEGAGIPSADLAGILVSNLCFAHNSPSLWKLVGQAVASRLLCPLHVLALLTPRVLPQRRAQPEAYRLYLELMKCNVTCSLLSIEAGPNRDKITKSIADALQLSKTYGLCETEFGHVVIMFVLVVVTKLIDSILEDCGFPPGMAEGQESVYAIEGPQPMDLDVKRVSTENQNEHREQLRRKNTVMALDVLHMMVADRKIQSFLRLVRPEKFSALSQRLSSIEEHKVALENLLPGHKINDLLIEIRRVCNTDYQPDNKRIVDVFGNMRSSGPLVGQVTGAGRAACWIIFDIYVENAIDGKHLSGISAIEVIKEMTRTLQVLNEASWQETFKALWISALRLVQRAREPLEGPIPHLDARLCMLLALIPLSVAAILKEESDMFGAEGSKILPRRQGLISSLQDLIQYSGLLVPPSSVANAANAAASKAAIFKANYNAGVGNSSMMVQTDSSTKAVGNMLHLIIEACISRSLIDTSAYLWPGYVVSSGPLKDTTLPQESPWLNFIKGAPLSGPLIDALVATPASSVGELDKLYNIAANGSEEEKTAAAKILCGASLVRGWNIQEHVVGMVVKLLSASLPSDTSTSAPGIMNHYLAQMSMLNEILLGVSYGDAIHILSLYGMVPDVAAALMPLCEAFGSIAPPPNHKSAILGETSVYSVFSCAFLCLLRLWKFYKPPQEYCLAGRGGSVRLELTLDYLLLMRNNRIELSNSSAPSRRDSYNDMGSVNEVSAQPVYIDSFPKLRAWYFQNQACIASTLSGLCNKNPVHQVANKILSMICRKMNKGGVSSGNLSSTSSGSVSGSSVNASDDSFQRPAVPAWEFLEAVPFVLEAVLTACAHGRLSSRDLTTSLRDLVDFLPASLAAIVSYFSAEITRGIWKPVPMNGIEWPSPGASLHSIEAEIKEILASAGVQIHSCYPRGVPPMLPLPMAALVSLTITFKLDRSLEYIQGVIGQALENCAGGSFWPSMPIIGALWTQKVRRWHDFIILSCLRSPFGRDKDAVAQLIQSCFSSFLQSSSNGSDITANRGVGALLGDSITNQGLRLPMAPGFIYLRTCRTFHDTYFVSEVILKQVIEWSHKLASGWSFNGPPQLKSGRTPLSCAASVAHQVAMLGAGLLCIAGGPLVVQVLYEETLPTLLLSAREQSLKDPGPVCSTLQGYAMANMLFFCGSLLWGADRTSPVMKLSFLSRRPRVVGTHMDFIAGVLDGHILLGCDPGTWKAYVSRFAFLVVKFVPSWLRDIKLDTLKKIAAGLRSWHEHDLALTLLERGGPQAISVVVETLL